MIDTGAGDTQALMAFLQSELQQLEAVDGEEDDEARLLLQQLEQQTSVLQAMSQHAEQQPVLSELQLAQQLDNLDVQLSQLEASLAAADAPTLELLGQSTSRWMHATGQTTAAGVNQPPGVQPDEPATSCDDVQDVSSSSKPTSVDAPDGQHLNSSTPTQATSSSIDTTGPSPDPSSSIQLSSSKQDRANSKEAADMQEAAAPVPGSSTAGAEVNSVVPEVAASGAEGDSSGP